MIMKQLSNEEFGLLTAGAGEQRPVPRRHDGPAALLKPTKKGINLYVHGVLTVVGDSEMNDRNRLEKLAAAINAAVDKGE